MAQFQQGDSAAFQTLYERYRNRIYRFIHACYEKNLSLVEEYTQEVFIKIIRSKDTYNPERKFAAWLFTVTRNHCLNRLASAPIRFEMLSVELEESEIGEKRNISKLEQQELHDLIQASIDELPELQRTIFVMRELDDMPHKIIAQSLSLSENNVRTQYHRAKKQLQIMLKPYWEVKNDKK